MGVHKSDMVNQIKNRQGHFAQIPNELWDAKISPLAKTVWAYLAAQGPGWDSSIANIGRNLGVSRSTATKFVNELREGNMLSTKKTKVGSDFILHSSDVWVCEWNRQPQAMILEKATIAQSKDRALYSQDSMAAQMMGGIQYSNTSNHTNTTDRKRSGMDSEDLDFRIEGENYCEFG